MVKYSIVSEQKRKQFIESVIVQNKGLTKMAKKFRIKLSTAKSIMRVFKKSGKILRKKQRISYQNVKKTQNQIIQDEVMIKQQEKSIVQTQINIQKKEQSFASQNIINKLYTNGFDNFPFFQYHNPQFYRILDYYGQNYQFFYWPIQN